jgi:hypothetical protein
VTDSLAQLVLAHQGNAELHLAMAAFFAEVDQSIARQNPVCRNRGACCRFDSFGHKLYVTGVELIYFVQGQRAAWRYMPAQKQAWRRADGTGVCPCHVGGECTARSHRPLGCRIFYCDPDTRDWQQAEYELWQGELRRRGVRFGVDYRYLEWLSALRELDGAISPAIRVPSDGIDAGGLGMIQ